MKNYFLHLIAVVGAVVVLSSCSKDLGPTFEEYQKNTYSTNFVNKYGAINPNQTWDFTTGEIRLTRGVSTITTQIMEKGISFGDVSKLRTTRKEFPQNHNWDYDVIEGGAEKNNDLLEALHNVLPEQKDKWKGTEPVSLVAPSSAFYIYPIFSGGNYRYDLKVKVGDQEPVTVFQKDYTKFQTINGMTKNNGDIVNMRGLKVEAPVGTPVEIYIDNIISLEGQKVAGAMGTTNGKAVYVDVPAGIVPELEDVTLKENTVIRYIGIEDVAAASSDNDYNDLVLAVIGDPDVPEKVIIENDEYEVKTSRTKRYMIEDLGATDDFDFNDVVVDVSENTITKRIVTYENGIKTSDVATEVKTAPTTAAIRAMGGTIDFELTIGDTKWVKSENGFDVKTMYNTQGSIDFSKALAEFEVTGWKPESNNISVKVTDEQSRQVLTITFPKAGTAPMIIAVEPTQAWMGERVSVPAEWFTE